MELDHLFIAARADAPESRLLREIGFKEGPSNQHKGQGTANRRFFFKNAYIELLFITDFKEINDSITGPTYLYERLSQKSDLVSPFGVCFRPSSSSSKPKFSCWSYKPEYLPPDRDVSISHGPLSEPMWFYLAFGSKPEDMIKDKTQYMMHLNGVDEITSVEITSPTIEPISEAAEAANETPDFSFSSGSEHLMTVSFNRSAKGITHDFRPNLPLKFNL